MIEEKPVVDTSKARVRHWLKFSIEYDVPLDSINLSYIQDFAKGTVQGLRIVDYKPYDEVIEPEAPVEPEDPKIQVPVENPSEGIREKTEEEEDY